MMLSQGKTPKEIKAKFPKMSDSRISKIKRGVIIANPRVPVSPPFHPSKVFKDMPKGKLLNTGMIGNKFAKKKIPEPENLSVMDIAKKFGSMKV